GSRAGAAGRRLGLVGPPRSPAGAAGFAAAGPGRPDGGGLGPGWAVAAEAGPGRRGPFGLRRRRGPPCGGLARWRPVFCRSLDVPGGARGAPLRRGRDRLMRSATGWARRHPRRGMAAVELAMCATVLTGIVLGATDFGRFAYTYIAVTNAARAGAFA